MNTNRVVESGFAQKLVATADFDNFERKRVVGVALSKLRNGGLEFSDGEVGFCHRFEARVNICEANRLFSGKNKAFDVLS